MQNFNLLKQYALNYLSKYDSTKKNIERILKNKVKRMKNIEKNEKRNLENIINQILENLESNKIINDENFASRKIASFFRQGRSETFIKNTLLKKGVNKKIINKLIEDLETNNSNWKIEAGEKFAKKNRLGKYGDKKNKKKDIAKMARAGFNYQIVIKILEYD